jgi:hypothetical protein
VRKKQKGEKNKKQKTYRVSLDGFVEVGIGKNENALILLRVLNLRN